MKDIKTLLAAALIAVLCAGCAGTDFKRPVRNAFQLGKSTTADILQVMGPPRQTGDLVKNSTQIKQLTYVYAAKVGAKPLYSGVIPARGMVFSTANDILVGTTFMSSFKEDGTDFDAAKLEAIVKGKTTRAEVVAALGAPGGEGIFPLTKGKEEKALFYTYSQTTGGVFSLKFYQKMLTVTLDANDVVADFEYLEGGKK